MNSFRVIRIQSNFCEKKKEIKINLWNKKKDFMLLNILKV